MFTYNKSSHLVVFRLNIHYVLQMYEGFFSMDFMKTILEYTLIVVKFQHENWIPIL